MDDVALRPLAEADLDDLASFATDPAAGGEFLWTGFRDFRRARRRWEEDGWLGGAEQWALAIGRGDDGAFAGFVSWWDRSVADTKGGVYEIGIALLPQHRGQGVGTAAQRLLVRYLLDNRPVHRIQAFTDVDNLGEQKALERAGFQREGVMREVVFRGGQWCDSVVYGLLRPDS